MRTARLLATGAFALMMFAGQSAHALEITHTLALNVGETKTWNGTWRGLGANVNYNGLVGGDGEGACTVTKPGDFDYDPRTLCEYAKVSVTNPVPDSDLDGKLKKNVSITLNGFALQSPTTDVDMRVYETDAAGTYKGAELGASANTDVVDPDEQVVLSVETTRTPLVSTKHYLVEIAYFTTVHPTDLCALPPQVRPAPCAPYLGTVTF